MKLTIGFCDIIVIYLNGKYLFSGYLPLKAKDEYVRMFEQTIDLTLESGKNELIILSSGYDNYAKDGGWGILMRINKY